MRAGAKSLGFTSNPVLTLRLPAWRSRFVAFAITLLFLALFARALWLQGFSRDFLQQQGASRYERVLEMPARRGQIMDRNGIVVASSVEVRAFWAIPDDVDLDDPHIRDVAKLLDMPEALLRAKLCDDDRNYVLVKRQVEMDVANKITALNVKGLHQRQEFKREYPEGDALAHVVGFADVEQTGQEGLELALDKVLAGKAGSRRVIKDRLGRVIEQAELLRAPVDGADVTLSIDSKIQSAVSAMLKQGVLANKAKAGAAIVVDAQTGEVLALSNYPSYDPNERSRLKGEQLRNRVLTDMYEPGSTMKPITLSLALDSGIVKPTSSFNTSPGRLTIGTNTISDTHDYGTLTVAGIIQKSSNIGTTKVALQMQPHAMWDFYTSVGFGTRPLLKLGADGLAGDAAFQGAASGRVRPWNHWKPIEQATMSYGYGISVSLAQMARAYTMFARDGEMIPLSLVKTGAVPVGVRIVKPETARTMLGMLETATGAGGTAPMAQVIGYRVAGKTGTARKQDKGVYLNGQYIASFIGLAPASAPRLIIGVLIDTPMAGVYTGGPVSGPVFSKIAGTTLRLMNIPPDAPYKTSIVVPDNPIEEGL
ncbi:penicillin-binding protein 2 [soil metagenome]